MSETPAKRFKRATVACNHCRAKRVGQQLASGLSSSHTFLTLAQLKCTKDDERESCMNCLLYKTDCDYSESPFLQNSKKADRPEKHQSPTKTRLGKRKRSTDSQSPGLAGPNSPRSRDSSHDAQPSISLDRDSRGRSNSPGRRITSSLSAEKSLSRGGCLKTQTGREPIFTCVTQNGN
jgi:hypothetical protein